MVSSAPSGKVGRCPAVEQRGEVLLGVDTADVEHVRRASDRRSGLRKRPGVGDHDTPLVARFAADVSGLVRVSAWNAAARRQLARS
jgi:hypothetical protein